MSKAHEEFRASAATKVNKILTDIDKLTKFSLSKDYDLDDVKQINEAIRKASAKMLKTLSNNLEEEEEFSFGKSETKVDEKPQQSQPVQPSNQPE